MADLASEQSGAVAVAEAWAALKRETARVERERELIALIDAAQKDGR